MSRLRERVRDECMIPPPLQEYHKIVTIAGKRVDLCEECTVTGCMRDTMIDYCKYGDADIE